MRADDDSISEFYLKGRVTHYELAFVRDAAKLQGITVSEFVRQAAFDRAEPILSAVQMTPAERQAVLAHVSKIKAEQGFPTVVISLAKAAGHAWTLTRLTNDKPTGQLSFKTRGEALSAACACVELCSTRVVLDVNAFDAAA